MPKKRKNDAEEKDALAPVDSADIEVKTEQPSQEESKDAPLETDGNDKNPEPTAVRTLRPRKTTCYTEKDSPDIDFDEKLRKGSRRKRRNASLDDVVEERDPKVKRAEKINEESDVTCTEKAISLDAENIELPLPTLASCTVLLSDTFASGKLNQNNNDPTTNCSTEGGIEDGEGKIQQTTQSASEKKRPKRKPKLKPRETVPLDPALVPKTEPVSPSSVIPETRKNAGGPEIESSNNKSSDTVVATTKPKPKKRIRPKKPAVLPSAAAQDGKCVSEDTPVIKQETGDIVDSAREETSGCEINKVVADDETKKASNAAPKKKPAKKKPKPTIAKDPLEANSIIPDKSTEKQKALNSEEDGTITEITSGNQKAMTTTVKKRPKSRPKKPATAKTTTSSAGDPHSNTEAISNEEADVENKEKNENSGSEKVGQTETRAQIHLARKPFFRGRRSKSFSARSGRKEIIHQAEEIDPEEIRGFEHVDKYVTPPGVKLPKFWDSEDEMSEDENNDNFRRIMCGFGTNCRIHEVIRPASEIVRRLKELQNTFGATKSLPLFQKDYLDSNEEPWSDPSEPFLRNDKKHITWHNDPGFFKFANNYPSKCK